MQNAIFQSTIHLALAFSLDRKNRLIVAVQGAIREKINILQKQIANQSFIADLIGRPLRGGENYQLVMKRTK